MLHTDYIDWTVAPILEKSIITKVGSVSSYCMLSVENNASLNNMLNLSTYTVYIRPGKNDISRVSQLQNIEYYNPDI